MAINSYAKIVNGKVVGLQNMEESLIAGFKGHWVEVQEEFGIGDLYDADNGWSHPVKTTEELEAEAKAWRDNELQSTDNVAQTPDYPNRDAILVYRQELRDWPSTDAFPDTKPIKP